MANTRQIAKYQTGKALLEFNDHLQPAPIEKASNLHSSFSKIKMVGMDYSEGKGDKTVIVNLNINPDTAKYLAEEVLRGVKLEFSEQKVLSSSQPNEAGEFRVTILTIKYNESMRLPWNVFLESGWGQTEKNAAGGTGLKKGTYRKERAVKVFMGDPDFKKLMVTVRDYIRAFEQNVFSMLMTDRQAYEQKEQQKTA